MRRIGFSTLTFVTIALAATAFADGHVQPAPDDAVKARRALMGTIAYHTGILGGMAKGDMPYDAALATAAAENLSAAASMNRLTFWVNGSDLGAVENTRAKPDIWSDPAGFETAAMGLETAAAAMVTAAGTDLDALRGAMQGLGGACSACHKAYRAPAN